MEVSGESLLLTTNHVNKYIRLTHSTGCEITVEASSNFQDGDTVQFRIAGGNTIILTPGIGVTLNNAGLVTTLTTHDNFSLKYLGGDVWDVIG